MGPKLTTSPRFLEEVQYLYWRIPLSMTHRISRYFLGSSINTWPSTPNDNQGARTFHFQGFWRHHKSTLQWFFAIENSCFGEITLHILPDGGIVMQICIAFSRRENFVWKTPKIYRFISPWSRCCGSWKIEQTFLSCFQHEKWKLKVCLQCVHVSGWKIKIMWGSRVTLSRSF